jgi:Lon protease-like protein
MENFNDALRKIPLFPLETVLFPDGVIALKIFEARYLDMIKNCMRENTEFGVVSIIKELDNNNEALSTTFSPIGTLAQIEDFDPVQPALYITKSLGTKRFKLLKSNQEPNGLWVGEVELLDRDPVMPIPDEHLKMAKLLDEIITVLQSEDLLSESSFKEPFKIDDCGWVSNRFAELLPISLAQKNHLLAQTNPRIRLDLITEIIEDDDLKNIIVH